MIQRGMKTAGKIIRTVLLEVSTVYTSCCLCRTHNIIRDRFHPAHFLFHLLPSGRRYRSLQGRTTRMANSLYPQTVRRLNKHCSPLPSPPTSIWIHYVPLFNNGINYELDFALLQQTQQNTSLLVITVSTPHILIPCQYRIVLFTYWAIADHAGPYNVYILCICTLTALSIEDQM